MESQAFSDGVSQVGIIGGTVRLDFFIYSQAEKDAKGQPAAIFNQRIVMSLDGFMQSAAKIQEAALVVAKLAQRAREGQSADASAAPAPAPAAAADTAPAPQKRPFP
jgi:hypothetical protein